MKKYNLSVVLESMVPVTDRITITEMGHHTHEGKYISYEKGKEKKKNKGLTLEVRLLGIVQM